MKQTSYNRTKWFNGLEKEKISNRFQCHLQEKCRWKLMGAMCVSGIIVSLEIGKGLLWNKVKLRNVSGGEYILPIIVAFTINAAENREELSALKCKNILIHILKRLC